MKVYERKGRWFVRGKGRSYSTKMEAEKVVAPNTTDWKLHIPEELPLPQVREYDSLEEAIADQDKDELDRFEDDLIAEEN